MNRKMFKIVFISAAALLIGGIFTGMAIKLNAQDDSGYGKKVMSKKTFSFNGETLYYSEPDDDDRRLYSDKIIYRNENGLYYYFDSDTQKLDFIDNKAKKTDAGLYAEVAGTSKDTESLLEDGRQIIGKWIDIDKKADIEWKCETDDLGYTKVRLYQNAGNGFSIYIAGCYYDLDGEFDYVVFNFDKLFEDSKLSEFISQDEAIENAKAFLAQEYGESEWEEIKTGSMASGQYGLFWDITFIKPDAAVMGYSVAVDIFTGEPHFFGALK